MTGAALHLRPARPLDAGALAGIVTAAAQRAVWKPMVQSAAEDLAAAGAMIDRGWTTLAEMAAPDGARRPAGFIAREAGEIHALFVAAPQTGHGIGKALLDHAKTRAPALTLWTYQANADARRFYLREGFREVAEKAGAANDHGLPEVHFHWRRKAAA